MEKHLAIKTRKKYFLSLKSFINNLVARKELPSISLGENLFTEKNELIWDLDDIFFNSVNLKKFNNAFKRMDMKENEDIDEIKLVFLMV